MPVPSGWVRAAEFVVELVDCQGHPVRFPLDRESARELYDGLKIFLGEVTVQ
jgi:hypothetical protein